MLPTADYRRDYSAYSVRTLLGMSDEQLAVADPLAMNLLVAREISSLANLEINQYQALANAWADDLRRRMPVLERDFQDSPQDWDNDIDFFRLGLVAWYVDMVLGIEYREDHKHVKAIRYTNPSDLFANGVIDTRRGTCGNMALVHLAIGRRLGLPVSLACAGAHFFLRYDDGKKCFNIETTRTGGGVFAVPTDEQVKKNNRLPEKAVTCGSDLRAVTPREMLGLFLGLRARYYDNTGRFDLAEPDYLLARSLFPQNRNLYFAQNQISVQQSMDLFEPGERAHPLELLEWLKEVCRIAPWTRKRTVAPGTPRVVKQNPFVHQVVIGEELG